MADKVVINLATGLEDAERVTVAFSHRQRAGARTPSRGEPRGSSWSRRHRPSGRPTFIDADHGVDPKTVRARAFDVVAGKRYFRHWLEQSIEGLRRAARDEVTV